MPFKITTTVTVDDNRVRSLLRHALEGDSKEWYYGLEPHFASGLGFRDFGPDGKHGHPDWSWHYTVPFVDGCYLTLKAHDAGGAHEQSDESQEYKLDRAAIKNGLKLMASESPDYWFDFMEESEDELTGDLFLRLCLFGKA